ncbi:MAG: DUF2189 domain-containing protein [Rhodocyclaceae bacterium]|nr:DUF2189 domain-containing protein [Rhodocyclaceae bacterium]
MDNSLKHLERHFVLPDVAQVPLLRPIGWIGAGWRDFRRSPAIGLSYGLVLVGFLALILSYAAQRPYLFTASVSGFLLIGPLLSVGLYEISRRVAAGETPTLRDLAAGWRRNSSSIGLFGILLVIVALGWERLSAIMFAMLYGGQVPDLGRFMNEVFLSGDYAQLVAVYFMAGGVLAVLVFAVSAVSLPMMLDRNTDMATAMMASVKACAANPAPMALWAAAIVLLVAVGFATFLVGMVFIMPVLGFATWHAYKNLIK